MLKDVQTTPPRPKRKWLRRLLVTLIVLGVLLLAAVITVQVILTTDIPRRLVVRGLERAMGVRVEVANVDTGWFGHTKLRDLKLTFPLADEPFLHAPVVDVEHTGLVPMLVLRRPLKLERAATENPELVIVQNETGRWNIQALAGGGGGKSESSSGGERKSVDIPDLDIRAGTIRIIDRRRNESKVTGVEIYGDNEASFVYGLKATAPDALRIEGRINLRDGQHTFAVDVRELADVLRPVVPGWPTPLHARGEWSGRVVGGKLESRVRFDELRALDYSGQGIVKLNFPETGGVVLAPDDLTVRGATGGLPQIELIDGEVRVTDDALVAQDLRATTGEGAAMINGHWTYATSTADMTAVWEGLTLPRGLTHSGRLTFGLQKELNGEPRLNVTLTNRGRAPAVQWVADLRLDGRGPDWQRLTWQLDVPKLNIAATELDLNLDGLSATIGTRRDQQTQQRKLVLDQLALPTAGDITGRGEVVLDDERRPWWVQVNANRLPISQTGSVPSELEIKARGNQASFELQRLFARLGELEVTADGIYDKQQPKPLDVNVHVFHPTPEGVALDDQPPLIGGLDARAKVTGTIGPTEIGFEANARGRSLRFNRREIGDVDFQLVGQARTGKIQWRTNDLQLFGGTWTFNGDVVTARNARAANVRVDVRDMPAKGIADMLKVEGVGGVVNGSWQINVPQLDASRLTVDGRFDASDIALAPTSKEEADIGAARGNDETPPQRGIHIGKATGRTTYRNRVLTVDEVVLQQHDGEMTGQLAVNLDDPQVLRADVVFSKWRVDLTAENAALQLYGAGRGLMVDLRRQQMTGAVDVATDVILNGNKVGEASIAGTFTGRSAEFKTIQADALGGRVWGKATVDLDRPLGSSGVLQFNDVDGAAVAALWPAAEGLAGKFRGVAELRPADSENRPVAPLRLTAFADPTDASFRGGQIGPMSLDAYVDTRLGQGSGTESPLRFVLDRARLNLFGGDVEAWGRFTQHGRGQMSTQTNVRFDRVSLHQVLQAFVKRDDENVPGLLEGDLTIVGNPLDRTRAFGQGNVKLTRSDLVNVDVFAALYNLMNINLAGEEPIGAGEVAFRIEGSSAELTRMRYFNRGVEVRAIGSFQEIWRMPDSPLDVTIVGTARPFKNLKLPFITDAEEVLATLQRDVTTVRVVGTVRNREIRQVAFQEIGRAMRTILLGDVEREAQRR